MKGLFVRRGGMGIALIMAVLICGFIVFYRNVNPILQNSEKEGTPVLTENLSPEALSSYLLEKGYLYDSADADCISDWLVSHLGKKPVKNLGALNKNPFRLPVTRADSLGGTGLLTRSDASRLTLGQDYDFRNLDISSLTSTFSCEGGKLYSIPVLIREENPAYAHMSGFKGRILNRVYKTLKKDYYRPVESVVIRINEYDNDNRDGVPIGYMITDARGRATFKGQEGHFYGLLPIQPGYEFGASVGTRNMEQGLNRDFKTIVRTRREHTIRLFDSFTYGRIKEDHALAVRSAANYRDTLVKCVFFFLAAWLVFYFLLGFLSAWKKKKVDYLMPLLLMAVTGIDILCMFSIADPLTDSLLGKDMVTGTVAGLALMTCLTLVNWERFYYRGIGNGALEFDFVLQFIRFLELPFPQKVASLQEYSREHRQSKWWPLVVVRYYVFLLLCILLLPLEFLMRLFAWLFRKIDFELPKGSGYLLIVLLFIFLLALFGDGPEGSGTKVNLFFFQPSELNKFLVVFFMAAYFSINARRIQAFSETLSRGSLKLQIRTVAFIVISIGLLLLLYMGVMSDMGPALVIIITFILLYAIARRDVGPMLLGIASYLLLSWLARMLPVSFLFGQILASLLWLGLWVAGGYFTSHRLYESAIFFNLLLFAFISGGGIMMKLGMESEGQRLLDRQQVAESLWNNDVTGGGDQVVQGIWSLATGGLTGQGLGKGDPNLVPAFNTDMIFTSIGEEMGFVVLLLLIVCFAILLHRCLVIGFRSGDSFLFFLAAGIALVTGVQLFVIVLGSLGIIPLTGVAVPFLSYGMTSLILNLGAMGILLSISGHHVDASLEKENAVYADTLATTSNYGFVGLTLVVLGVLLFYQGIRRNHFLVKPAYVCNEQGIKLQEYNPRIRRLMRKLESGDIFDRNGMLLATSSREELSHAWELTDSLFRGKSAHQRLGERSQALRLQYLRRYYPFGNDLFFMLGDMNTMTLWGIERDNPFGYLAEDRHQAELLGFETAMYEDGKVVSKTFEAQQSVSPFLPAIDTTFGFNVRDYSDRRLLRMLKQGTDGRAVKRWNEQKHKRDLYLTVDARLQTQMQDRMAVYVPALQNRVANSLKANYGKKRGRETPSQKVRASVVVLDVDSGDLLTSAVFPRPDQDTIRTLLDRKMDYLRYEREPSTTTFTDRDLGLTFLTQPGSTAKVMSSIAAFMSRGDGAANLRYTVQPGQGIGHDNPGTYTMQSGLVHSVNAFFIKLVNDNDLYPQLDSIYRLVGNRIGDDQARQEQKSYYFTPDEFSTDQRTRFHDIAVAIEGRAIPRYQNYVETRSTAKMNAGDWGWAWGQGTLNASPLSMARVASIVAHQGSLVPTRYVLARGKGEGKMEMEETKDPIPVITPRQSELLRSFMREETRTHSTISGLLSMGGKTGTPERSIRYMDDFKDEDKFNDAWYVCFVRVSKPGSRVMSLPDREGYIAVALRIERTYKFASGEAARMISSVVVPALRDAGYQVLNTTE